MNILSARYLSSQVDWRSCPAPDLPEYALIGRSNVGKSSLINMLTGSSKLAKTSRTPGKTRTINHFLVEGENTGPEFNQNWLLADLPGYGFAHISQIEQGKWQRMVEEYLKYRSNLVSLLVLIDSRHTPQKIDLEFINRLGGWKIPFLLVFTKSDKSPQALVSRNVKAFLKALEERWEEEPPHVVTSAVRNSGRDILLNWIGSWNRDFRKG